MNRRKFLHTLGAGSVLLAAPGTLSFCRAAKKTDKTPARTQKPNVILINVDDLGWADLSCYGSSYHETDHIDSLAARGMRFTDAYAACAVCSPTRASILTGRYPARIGITDWIHHLDRAAYTAVGTGRHPVEYVGSPERALLCPPNPYWMDLEEVTIAEALKPAGYTTGHIGKWHLGHSWWYPEHQGFDINIGGCEIGQPPTYFDPYYQNPRRSSIPTLAPRKQGEYLTDREADEAVRFIRDHKDQPFFLHYCPYAVHTPLQAPKKLVSKYRKKKTPHQSQPVYAAMLESVDHAVGRILQALDRYGLREQTLIIFTSDNGGLQDYATDNAPLRAGKGYPYEGGIRVPLIVCWSGRIEAGTLCRIPVTSPDLFPTICAAAGVPLPEGRVIDGKNLWPLLSQKDPFERNALFWHFPHYRGDVVPYSIIRKDDWKLIRRYEGRRFELFNLREDIGEKNDLSDRMPDKVRELDALLQTWLEETGARLPVKDPDERKDPEKTR